MTKASRLLVASLCGVVVLLSACRRQEGSAEPRTSKETDTALFPVNVGGKYGFINSKGSLVIPAQFDAIPSIGTDSYGPDYFSEGLAAVCIGRCDFVKNGEILRNEHGPLEQEVWQGSWGYIDKTGRFAINPQFSEAGSFAHGLASAITGERKLLGDNRDYPRCGYMDHAGKFVIPIQFSTCKRFDDAGMAAVAVGDGDDSRMGFINTAGRFLISPQFWSAQTFHDGLAQVYPNKDTRYPDYQLYRSKRKICLAASSAFYNVSSADSLETRNCGVQQTRGCLLLAVMQNWFHGTRPRHRRIEGA